MLIWISGATLLRGFLPLLFLCRHCRYSSPQLDWDFSCYAQEKLSFVLWINPRAQGYGRLWPLRNEAHSSTDQAPAPYAANSLRPRSVPAAPGLSPNRPRRKHPPDTPEVENEE